MSDSVRPHRWQPTRLFCPWNFPGKSTGVGCHCLLHHKPIAAADAKSLQSCPTLCDPIDGSLPGSPIPRILQVRTLEWVAISFSNLTTEARPFLFQFSSVAQSCQTLCNPMDRACQASLSITNCRSLLRLMSIESVIPSNHLIICCPLLLLLSIFPASGSFL